MYRYKFCSRYITYRYITYRYKFCSRDIYYNIKNTYMYRYITYIYINFVVDIFICIDILLIGIIF